MLLGSRSERIWNIKIFKNLLEFYIIVSLLPNYYILNIIEYIFIMKFVFGIINIYLDSNSCKKTLKINKF